MCIVNLPSHARNPPRIESQTQTPDAPHKAIRRFSDFLATPICWPTLIPLPIQIIYAWYKGLISPSHRNFPRRTMIHLNCPSLLSTPTFRTSGGGTTTRRWVQGAQPHYPVPGLSHPSRRVPPTSSTSIVCPITDGAMRKSGRSGSHKSPLPSRNFESRATPPPPKQRLAAFWKPIWTARRTPFDERKKSAL